MKTTKLSPVDVLVRRITAFRSWNEMVKAMDLGNGRQGYCPTLNGGKAYAKLAGICRRNGFKVFRNGQVA